jgi:hypothetical protein
VKKIYIKEYSKSEYMMDKKNNSTYKGIGSIK